MTVNHVGSFDIPYAYRIAAVQGDTLTLYDYEVIDQTIIIKRGSVLPEGYIQPQNSIFTYPVSPDWGSLYLTPLFFQFKNDRLYSAFKTDSRVIVLFTDDSGTEVHTLNSIGIRVQGDFELLTPTFYIQNNSVGYLSDNGYSPNWLNRIYKMDFNDDSLTLFYEDTNLENLDTYCYLSLADEYILMFTPLTHGADLLVRDGVIVQSITGGWGYSPAGYRNTSKLCDDYYHTIEMQTVPGWENSLLAWVENDNLQRALVDYGEYPYIPVHYVHVIATTDTTFSCILRNNFGDSFQNMMIRQQTICLDSVFPDLSVYNRALAYIKMDEQYMLGIAGTNDNDTVCILVDRLNHSIRPITFDIDDASDEFWRSADYVHSSRLLFAIGHFDSTQPSDHLLHIFTLSNASFNSDDFIQSVEIQIKAFPNPTHNKCIVLIDSSLETDARAFIYNIKGQKINELHIGLLRKGGNTFQWDGLDSLNKTVTTGIYVLKLETAVGSATTKIVIIK